MSVSAVPRPPDVETKELRLALVCYGGVSLAIYMYGVTKELHKLVRASAQLDRRAGGEPDAVETVYAKALVRAAQAGNRTRVVIDVIAGTSAGGINGICLAKALANDVSQDKLLDLWLSRGDFARLIDLKPLLRSIPAPILSGKKMLGWVRQALDDMDAESEARGEPSSLMPDGHELELYITTTDFGGYGERVPLSDPWGVTEPVHRHRFRFASVGGRDVGTLARRWNPALAFAARATSSFPGAFPPAAIGDLGDWKGRDAFVEEFFRPYVLANPQADPLASWFVDGGVLDNKPFDHALRAVFRKAAAVEVDRRLLFIEPDPGGPPPAGDGRPPSWRRTVWGALSRLPAAQPILDQLLLVRDFNERVARVRDVAAASRESIAERVAPLKKEIHDWSALTQALVDDAAAYAGAGYIPYLRLKLHEVVARFAAAGAEIGGFPPESSHASFVRAVVVSWARDVGVFDVGTRPNEVQIEFLRAFDVSYRERRVRYAIALVNRLYASEEVDRRQLDTAKEALYLVARELVDIFERPAAAELGSAVRALFDPLEIARNLDPSEGALPASFAERVDVYARAHAETLGRLHDGLREILAPSLEQFGERTWQLVQAVSEGWQAQEARDEFRVDFLGFPHWDALVFPLRELSDVGELNPVQITRVSPRDATLLGMPTEQKLEGIGLRHFRSFFRRAWRENDYLWGRLDAAERMIRLVATDAFGQPLPCDDLCREAFGAILADERRRLSKVRDLIDRLSARVGRDAGRSAELESRVLESVAARRYDEAFRILREAESAGVDWREVVVIAVDALDAIAAEDATAALGVANRALDGDPGWDAALASRDIAIESRGRSAEAERIVDRMLKEAGDDLRFLRLKGRLLRRHRNDAQWESWLREQIEEHSRFGWAHAALAQSLRDRREYDEAVAEFRLALAAGEDVFAQLLDLLRVLARWEDALELLEGAVAGDPTSASLHAERGRVLWALGRVEEALAALHQSAELAPHDARVLVTRAAVLGSAGRLVEAVGACDAALRLSKSFDTLVTRARALIELGEFEEAIADLDAALGLAPTNLETYLLRGWAALHSGKADQSLADFRAAVGINHDDVWARRGLGDALVAVGDQRSRAEFAGLLELLKSAKALDYLDAASLAGWCLYRLGKYERAIETFSTALAIDSLATDVQFDLALAAIASGAPLQAVAEYQRGIDLARQQGERMGSLLHVALVDLREAAQIDPAVGESGEFREVERVLEDERNTVGQAIAEARRAARASSADLRVPTIVKA